MADTDNEGAPAVDDGGENPATDGDATGESAAVIGGDDTTDSKRTGDGEKSKNGKDKNDKGGKESKGKKDKKGKGKKKKKDKDGERPEQDGAEVLPSPSKRRVVLTGISSRTWEHPADRGALTALRELRGFDDVLKVLSAVWTERGWRLMFLGNGIKVDHRQYQRIHRLYAEAATSLDVAELPELFVRHDRRLNAMCVGLNQPFIVVNSGAIELLDDDELRCLLGHELGHALSGHAVYRTMIIILTQLALGLAWLPVGAFVLRGIIAALFEWWRKAELSADRAGLLACQDPAASLRLSMKLAGGGDLSEIDTTAFLEQAAEYERSGDVRDSLLKLLLIWQRSHPLPVARAAEIQQWIDSGAYQRILGGDYPRRADDADASIPDDVKEAADSYRDAFARSQDPLAKLLRRLGAGADGVGEWVGAGAGRVREWMFTAGRSARDAAAGNRDANTGT